MKVVIASSSSMAGVSEIKVPGTTLPRFQNEANEIVQSMMHYSASELGHMLNVNRKLALENYFRFHDFFSGHNPPLQAIAAYTGTVFKNMGLQDFTSLDFHFTQDSLSIISLCFGLLSPFDLVKPYRMEPEVTLPEFDNKNMYDLWRDKLTPVLLDEIKISGGILVNLASKNAQAAFHWKKIEKETRVITPVFKIWKSGKMQTVVIYTKMARGQMTRYIIKNRIADPEALKAFSWEGFTYNKDLSDYNNWVFLNG